MSRQQSNIYCGNNQLHESLTNGSHVIGTRYQCLRKGIGQGLNMPIDRSYSGNYQAIDKRSMYCGNANQLPQGYDILGSSPMCLQKGVGIGKNIKFKRQTNHNGDAFSPSVKSEFKGLIPIFIYIFLYIGFIYICVKLFKKYKHRKEHAKNDKKKF